MISIDDPGLRVVATSFDETEAASAALGRSEHWQPPLPAVLRHHLLLPDDQLAAADELLAPDGWTLRPGDLRESGTGNDLTAVVALRVQIIDALRCSQESSRMASLAQRLGGRAAGWDALQPGPG
ncbi:hypothetical protein [Saccharopolyspora taberi]|uniref:Uncharacterized protein n=1 Tax=Saccharopolyspora taberi TaxID=60895 RepID=A0ABN3VG56_9PSEU